MSSSSTLPYNHISIFLHWLIALGILCMIPLGAYMHGLPLSPSKFQLYLVHKSLGITILMLVLVRLLWRLTHTPPALPLSMTALEQKLAHAMQHALYLFMITSPITGWLMSSAFGKPVILFDAIPLPDLVAPSEALGDTFKLLHMISNISLSTLISLHVLAALKHHFKDKDEVLVRMLPILSRRS